MLLRVTSTDRSAADAGVQVVVLDVDRAIPSLPAPRPSGQRWSGAWLVVRDAGEPLGMVEVPLAEQEVLSAQEVRARVEPLLAGPPRRQWLSLPDTELPRISVVVATDLRRPERLRACLAALGRLDYPDFEVLVVDNHRGATGGEVLEEMVAGMPFVRVVREAVPGLSVARNTGVRAARGSIVAFTDDDVLVDRGWLRAIGTRFALRPEEDAVTGLILPADLETTAQLWFERHYGGFGGPRGFTPLSYCGSGPGSPVGKRARITESDWDGRVVRRFALYGAGVCGAGANMSFRVAALRRLGGFDTALGAGTPARGGEDLFVFMRLLWDGGTIGFEPRAVVSHNHRADYAGLRRQLFDYGLGFTALLTALAWHDRRQVLGILSQVPPVVRMVLGADRNRPVVSRTSPALEALQARSQEAPPPGSLRLLERLGLLVGPPAYLRSRLRQRRLGAGAPR
jgi:glycosyltransferase involved in cell wall biosynthesis